MANVQVRTGGQTCRELGTKGPVPAGRVDVWLGEEAGVGRRGEAPVGGGGVVALRSRPTGIRGR